MKVYRSRIVTHLQEHYGELLLNGLNYPLVKAHLTEIAYRFKEGVEKSDEGVLTELNNYHPKYIGISIQELATYDIPEEDCYECVALQYGYKSWDNFIGSEELKYSEPFERALHYLLHGQISELSQVIDDHPDVINMTSPFGHKAQLLNYTASNGVELWRQQVPKNLPEVISLLIEKGANVRAQMKVYGGEFDTLSLLTSSAHPYEAGVGKRAEQILLQYMA